MVSLASRSMSRCSTVSSREFGPPAAGAAQPGSRNPGYQPRVKVQSAGWVKVRSARTVRFDALSVQVPIVGVAANPAEPLALTADEIAEFRAGVKFSECVPPERLARTIGAREFETAQEGG